MHGKVRLLKCHLPHPSVPFCCATCVSRIAHQGTPPFKHTLLSCGQEPQPCPVRRPIVLQRRLQQEASFTENNHLISRSLSTVGSYSRCCWPIRTFLLPFPLHGNIDCLKTRSHQSPVAELDLRGFATANFLLSFATCLPLQANCLACTADSSSGPIGTQTNLSQPRPTTCASLLHHSFRPGSDVHLIILSSDVPQRNCRL